MWFLKTALTYLGTPYLWGGDDPSGFDCSGFVVECLKSVGLIPEKSDYTADGLLRLFARNSIDSPVPGGILFRLSGDNPANDPAPLVAVHVVICLDEHFQIGASGGSSGTKDISIAWDQNAFIKIRPIHRKAGSCRIIDPFMPAS